MANRAVQPSFAHVDPDPLRPPVNLLRSGLHPCGFARIVVNRTDVRAVFRNRIARQLAIAPDPELEAIFAGLLTSASDDDAASQRIAADVVIAMIVRVGGHHPRRGRDRVVPPSGRGKRCLFHW